MMGRPGSPFVPILAVTSQKLTKQPEWSWSKMGKIEIFAHYIYFFINKTASMGKIETFAPIFAHPIRSHSGSYPLKYFKTARMAMGCPPPQVIH